MVAGTIACTMLAAACFAEATKPFNAVWASGSGLGFCEGTGIGAGAGAEVGGGRAGARRTLFRLPIGSSSVGWSSVVVHLPSTMYLYAILSPHGTCTVPWKWPDGDLER